jgi:stage V sporulation protein SpoVS
VLRASRPDDITTYKAVAAVAAAQKQLSQAGKVAVYVPYTKASRFTAQLVTADATITDSITTEPLTVKANTDAAALGNTLAFALLRDGGATVGSAGAAATAKAAEAMRVARALLIKKGFEIGVVPKFAESVGSNGDQVSSRLSRLVAASTSDLLLLSRALIWPSPICLVHASAGVMC